jgi:hypothetical protein
LLEHFWYSFFSISSCLFWFEGIIIERSVARIGDDRIAKFKRPNWYLWSLKNNKKTTYNKITCFYWINRRSRFVIRYKIKWLITVTSEVNK